MGNGKGGENRFKLKSCSAVLFGSTLSPSCGTRRNCDQADLAESHIGILMKDAVK